MTLTYRGKKYDQQKVAGGSAKPALTYRGVSYAKLSRLYQTTSPCLRRGFLIVCKSAPTSQKEMGWAPEAG